MRSRTLMLVVGMLAASLTLAACSDDDEGTGTATGVDGADTSPEDTGTDTSEDAAEDTETPEDTEDDTDDDDGDTDMADGDGGGSGGDDGGMADGDGGSGGDDGGMADGGDDAGSTDAGDSGLDGGDGGVPDGGDGGTDGGGDDAGTDGGSTDAGSTDAGSTDAGSTDAGTLDSGTMDAADGGGGDTGPANFVTETDGNCPGSPAATVQVGPGFTYTTTDSSHDATKQPGNITVNTGEWVNFEFNGFHSVTGDKSTDFQTNVSGACGQSNTAWFDSGQKTIGTFCVQFNKTGTFYYQCTVRQHCEGGMWSWVKVQ